ncbi:DivIVA domain-containing protein [Georgenia sp. MJ173]|uniref:DivIVA domain-containing protein n=1 Tax=Georgenia sunbinii TaxID=3117728 RepID=UPI002F26A699
MALLTADDVLNKKFQPTKFREGYDQDEVDDFLDEVVNTLSSLQNENEELKAKLAAAERRVSELSSGEAVAAPVETAPEPVVEAEPEPQAAPEPEPEVEPEVAASFAPAAAVQADAGDAPTSAAGMLALAQKVHDEYVSNGKAEGDRVLHEAKTEADRIVREAEDTHNRTLAQLEQERSLLERKIDELRVFERDYRTRLKSYLESLLSDVEGRGNVSGRGEQNAPQFGH